MSGGNIQIDEARLPNDFRMAMRKVPGAVAVLTMHSDGQDLGMTATAVCSLAAEPPKLLACINQSSRFGRALTEGAGLAVSFTGEDQTLIAAEFGRRSAELDWNFKLAHWRRSRRGALILEGACASFDCVVEQIIPNATHYMVVLEVCDIVPGISNPLLHWNGSFAAVSGSAAH